MSPRKKNKKPRGNQRRRSQQGGRPRKKKPCYFCQEKLTYVDFKDVAVLRKPIRRRELVEALESVMVEASNDEDDGDRGSAA